MKRQLVECDEFVTYVRWDDEDKVTYTLPQPCQSPAIYALKDGRHLCSVHARGVFVEHAISAGYAKRMYRDKRGN